MISNVKMSPKHSDPSPKEIVSVVTFILDFTPSC